MRVLSVFVSDKRFIVISLFIIVFETTIFLSPAFQLGSMRHAPFTRCAGAEGKRRHKASVNAGGVESRKNLLHASLAQQQQHQLVQRSSSVSFGSGDKVN